MEKATNNAKFAFFYMLSLVSLIFVALSVGMIVFQIINKNIVDIISDYSTMYSSGVLKFAISAIIISAPIYFLTMWQINKNLYDGALDKHSEIRKWLTYFILFVSSVTMIGWLIGTIYNFLDGELTIKFILKSLTSILIAGAVFSYYFYDIKRENVVGAKDVIVRIYFYSTLVIVIASLASAFLFVESPTVTRQIKQDMAMLQKFDKIDGAINSYVAEQKKMPVSLVELRKKNDYILESDLKNMVDNKAIEYKVKSNGSYEICANFLRSNKDDKSSENEYMNGRWSHDAGHQCFQREVINSKDLLDKQAATTPAAPAKTVPVKVVPKK